MWRLFIIPLEMATSDGSVPATTTCTTTDSEARPSRSENSSSVVLSSIVLLLGQAEVLNSRRDHQKSASASVKGLLLPIPKSVFSIEMFIWRAAGQFAARHYIEASLMLQFNKH